MVKISFGNGRSRKFRRVTMEEEMLSMVLNGGLNVMAEASDLNSSIDPFHSNNHLGQTSNASSIKFKGVVPHQNGHWGAQIYANHQQIWLRTFKSKKEAAMAYDSAGIKLRSGDSHRNFPWTHITIQEPNFQNLYSTEAVLNMIKDGSYPTKFVDFLKTQSQSGETEGGLNLVRVVQKNSKSITQIDVREIDWQMSRSEIWKRIEGRKEDKEINQIILEG